MFSSSAWIESNFNCSPQEGLSGWQQQKFDFYRVLCPGIMLEKFEFVSERFDLSRCQETHLDWEERRVALEENRFGDGRRRDYRCHQDRHAPQLVRKTTVSSRTCCHNYIAINKIRASQSRKLYVLNTNYRYICVKCMNSWYVSIFIKAANIQRHMANKWNDWFIEKVNELNLFTNKQLLTAYWFQFQFMFNRK